MRNDERWQRIAETAIHDAERVNCSLAEFAAGLRVIELMIRDRRELADDEVKHIDRKDRQ